MFKRRPNKALYKTRHRVESFFQRVKRYRRIATRYEKLAQNFLSMVAFAAVLTWPL
jgi:transposase